MAFVIKFLNPLLTTGLQTSGRDFGNERSGLLTISKIRSFRVPKFQFSNFQSFKASHIQFHVFFYRYWSHIQYFEKSNGSSGSASPHFPSISKQLHFPNVETSQNTIFDTDSGYLELFDVIQIIGLERHGHVHQGKKT